MKSPHFAIFCLVLAGVVAALVTFVPRSAYAAASCSYSVNTNSPGSDAEECSSASYCMVCVPCCIVSSWQTMVQDYFNDYRSDFIMDSFYQCPAETTFKSQANDMRSSKTFKTSAWGAFLDASVLNDTLLALSSNEAETLKAYTPSEQICKFGTLTRALAASESKMDTDRIVLGDIGVAKNLGRINSISAGGRGSEFINRLKVFVEKFCSLKDNNNGLEGTCMSATPVIDVQHNRDVDFPRLMANMSINGDFTDATLTMDETSLLMMGHSLYGHRQPVKRFSHSDMRENQTNENLNREYRSAFARRAAAQNTFNTLTAMRLAGSGASDTYMKDVLSYIGFSAANADIYLGGKSGSTAAVKTSYNGQMNLLAKQLYQDPAFYATLMDSKTNVKRTSAAMQGIGLMQARDTYKSMARSEMLAAILVELEAVKIANNEQGEKSQ